MRIAFHFLTVFVTFFAALLSLSHAEGEPKVEIFYESLQVNVRQFFIEQFRVVSENLLDNIDLRLYPYGNTINNGDNTYTCKSTAQCLINSYHACTVKNEILSPDDPLSSVDKPINQSSTSRFLNCFFKNRLFNSDPQKLGKSCFQNDVSWPSIAYCALVEPVTSLFESVSANAKEELEKNNGLAVKVSGEFIDLKTTNLVDAICKQLTDVAACTQSTKPSNVKIGVYYEALNSDARKYLAKQLGNFYYAIEDLASIDLVPYGNTVKDGDVYNCPQGPAQCISNKFQALVVDKYITNSIVDDLAVSGPIKVARFLQCLAQSSSGNEFTLLETCSESNLQKGDYATFIKAINNNSTDAEKVFENMQTKTKGMLGANSITTLPRVPTVTLNGKISYNALNDLLSEACAQQWIDSKAITCAKTKVTVLYEPLNHRSRSFFLEQLNSIFSNLLPLLDVELIPAGKAGLTAVDNELNCINGLDQCMEMQLHACVLEHFWNGNDSYAASTRQSVFDSIWCTFKNRHLEGVMDVAEHCANVHIELDPWRVIHDCYDNGRGKDLVAAHIKTTQELVGSAEYWSVPMVFVNGTNVTDLATAKTKICELYTDSQPAYCSEPTAKKVSLSVYYESTDEISKHFFTTQYGQWYTYLEELADIQLFPGGNIVENGTDNGTCDSYGPDSGCMANKLMAVVIDTYSKNPNDGDFIDGTLRTMLFHRCYYAHPHFRDSIYDAAEYCAEETLSVDAWFGLEALAKSPEGAALYAEVLKATAQLKVDLEKPGEALSLIPWVTVEGSAPSMSRVALNDLLQTVCEKYTGADRPLECQPVEVAIFYSARHAQSRRFFVEQLQPVYWHLRERLQLKLVPYGLVNASLTIDEECAGKADNCLSNKAQACALKLYYDAGENTAQWDGRNQTLTFINCMFKNVGNEEDGAKLVQDCSNKDFIIPDEVLQCAQQKDGMTYLKEMRDLTLALNSDTAAHPEPMEHAPWILINGVRSAQAQSDLKEAVCEAMLGDKPDFCQAPTPPKVKVAFHYSAQDAKVRRYVLEELYPHYRKLEEVIDLDVIPVGLTDIVEQHGENGTGTGQYTLYCTNGPEECKVNLIHGCLYEQYYHSDEDPDSQEEFDGKLQFIEFLRCYFDSPQYPGKIVDAAASCVEQIFKTDALNSALECARTSLGQSILEELAEKKVATLLPHIKYIPWITVDGKHSYTIEHHIQRTICDAYQGTEKPLDCYEASDYQEPDPKVAIHYEIGDAASKDFFAKLSNESSLLTTVSDITLVPFGRSTYTSAKNCRNNADCAQYKDHACLLKLFFEKHPHAVLKAIACTFDDDHISAPDVVNQCVNDHLSGVDETVPDPFEEIIACVAEQGDSLMGENEQLVADLTPALSHVPWVMVDGEHDPEAEDSLMNELCGYFYPMDKPAACIPKPLQVAVYYETNNTAVGAFFKNQISGFTEYLDEFGQFSFIPYGTATTTGNLTKCSSDNQCTANAFHACVINRFYNSSSVNPSSEYEKNRIRTAGFLECAFFEEGQGKLPLDSAKACFNINFENVDERDVLSCAIDGEGQELLVEMGRQTAALDPKLTNAPVVTISGVQNNEQEANFFQKLCTTYGDIRPAQCTSVPSSAVKLEVYFSGNDQGFALLADQLYPFYEEIVPLTSEEGDLFNVRAEYDPKVKLYSIIDAELIAWGATVYDSTNTETPFSCTGKNECYINRYLACAKYYHADEPKGQQHLVKLALCAAKNSTVQDDPSEVFNQCTNLIWPLDAFTQLHTCASANNAENVAIFLKEKEKTDSHPEITSFPAVTLNRIVNANATQFLLAEVCQRYDSYSRPPQCKEFYPEPPVIITTPVTTPVSPVSTPITTPTPTGPTSTPTGPTSTPPPGSGTTQTVSIIVLLVAIIISQLLL